MKGNGGVEGWEELVDIGADMLDVGFSVGGGNLGG
jgi:hypothetical protein